MKVLAAWCCLVQIALAVNPEMMHKLLPAVDHSSSLLMAPPMKRSAPISTVNEKAKSPLAALQGATSFKSLRATAVSLCPHAHNDTQRVCSGHGFCTDDYRCICSSGYTGVDCSTKNTCPSGCSGAGSCNSFGICECDVGYAGEDCSKRSCPSQCSQHGICDPPNGCQCFNGWAGAACDVSTCPQGCSGHGVCQNNTCTCTERWTDTDCARPRCSAICQHGQCVGNVCQCEPGWVGSRCSTSACEADREIIEISANGTMEGNMTSVCGSHGICGGDGQCQCHPGWAGDRCDTLTCPQVCGVDAKCVEGKCMCAGRSCPKVPCNDSITGCNDNGVCFRGRCVCDSKWLGEACEVRRCPSDCSGNGNCVNGQCECNPPFRGKDCTAKRCPTALSSGAVDIYFTDGGSVLLKRRKANSSEEYISPNETLKAWERLVGPSVCSGHGVCQKNGNCACEAGWENPACSAMTCPKHCHDHGVCVNFKCRCNQGYEGRTCALRTCGPECENNHGSCNNGTCVCMTGWNGTMCNQRLCDPECSDHGRCLDGTCFCEDGWGGKTCAGHLCRQTCSSHGRCVDNNCLCQGGWMGKDCTEQVCPGNGKCSGHGACTTEGTCNCTGHFSGKDCSICDSANFFGPDCDQPRCPDDCSNNGICKGGKCYCAAGYVGQTCSMKSCPMLCNNRGVCKNGECDCQLGFAGTACELGQNKTCPEQCGGHGTCNVTNGNCDCEPGYDGAGCTLTTCQFGCSGNGVCVNHVCKCKENFSGAGCELSVCPKNCTGNGQCIDGACFCKTGWTGKSCGVKLCPSLCSNHGQCNKKGVCHCLTNWTGLDCSQPVGIFVGDHIEVPINDVLYPGIVILTHNAIRVEFEKSTHVPNGKGVRKGFLQRSWSPRVLSKMMCRDCSNHGTCLGYKCECRPGWGGKFCDEGCPEDCSGHGACNKGVCSCEQLWVGAACAVRSCSGHGIRKSGVCICERGWSGELCGCPTELDDTNLPVHLSSAHLRAVQNFNNVCSGHGRCVQSKCECSAKWTGLNCATPAWMAPSYNCAAECVFTCMKKCSTTGDLAPHARLRGDNDCYLRCSRRCNADCLAQGEPEK